MRLCQSTVVNTFEFMHLDHKESLDNAVELVITLLLHTWGPGLGL